MCCLESSNDPFDPLIDACNSDTPTLLKDYTFESDSCTSITTTTTIFRDASGNIKATREETGETVPETDEMCCMAAISPISELLLACPYTESEIDIEYSYEDSNCKKTYTMRRTYMNAFEIFKDVDTVMMESGLPAATCCA